MNGLLSQHVLLYAAAGVTIDLPFRLHVPEGGCRNRGKRHKGELASERAPVRIAQQWARIGLLNQAIRTGAGSSHLPAPILAKATHWEEGAMTNSDIAYPGHSHSVR